MISLMITLLMTTEAQDMSTGFSEMHNDAGERVYSSFSSGDYVQRTEALKQGSDPAIPADATVLYVIMYLDSTWVNPTGKQSSKPLSMTLGNFPKSFLAQDSSKRVFHALDFLQLLFL